MSECSAAASGIPLPQRTTLLALVQTLTLQGHSEREIVTEVLELVEGGRVVLCGSFRATPLCPTRPKRGLPTRPEDDLPTRPKGGLPTRPKGGLPTRPKDDLPTRPKATASGRGAEPRCPT